MIKILRWFLPLCLIASAQGATVNKTVKTKSEYHEMCGCKHVFWRDRLEGGAGQPNFTNQTYANPGAYGSTACNRVPGSASTWSSLTLPNCVALKMAGENNRLTGTIKAEKFAYVKIYGEYTVGGTSTTLERVYAAGSGAWKEFSYYFDFSGITNVTDVKLYINVDPLNGVAQSVDVDEIKICHFCNGSTTEEYPVLSNIKFLDGSTSTVVGRFTTPFDKYAGTYTVIVPSQTISVKIQPTLLVNALFPSTVIMVNGATVASGTNSAAISVDFSNFENYPVIDIELNSGSGICPVKTYYRIAIEPEEPLADATLYSLNMAGADQKLVPGYSRYTTAYDVTCPPNVESVQIIPVANERGAIITVNGEPVASGALSQEIYLNETRSATILVVSRLNNAVRMTYTLDFIPFSSVVYVKESGSDLRSGFSWDDAKASVEAGLATAASLLPSASNRIEVWIAEGEYRRAITAPYKWFQLIPFVDLKGGFPADGGTEDERDWKINSTILSGDIQDNDGDYEYPGDWPPSNLGAANYNDNAGCVMIGADNASIDGFVVEKGFAKGTGYPWASYGGGMWNSGESPKVSNCLFRFNIANAIGGAVFNQNSELNYYNCIFSQNMAQTGGGAIGCSGINGTNNNVVNCLFVANRADNSSGGAMHLMTNSNTISLTVTNCTFSSNYAGTICGGVYTQNSKVDIYNSVFCQNSSTVESSKDVRWDMSTLYPVTVYYSLFSTGQADLWVTGNGNQQSNAPGLTSDYHIVSTSSSCYNRGNLSQDPAVFLIRDNNDVPLDLDALPRFYNNGRIDRGVYELQQ